MDISKAFAPFTWAKEELSRHFKHVRRGEGGDKDTKELVFHLWNVDSARGVIITVQTPYFTLKNDEQGAPG